MPLDSTPIWLTLQLAATTTVILLIVGTPLAWWLSRSTSWVKPVIEAIVALPLVLPPTVLGFYLLVAMGTQGPLGQLGQALGWGTLAFTFPGLVIGSVFYSLPFVVQPLQNAFEATSRIYTEAAACLRAAPLDRFFTVSLPLAKRGFITAITLGFAHTVGEFGVVLMIGGNIPGKTQVISIAIYNHVEALEYAEAHVLSAGLLLFSFLVLLAVFAINRRFS